MLCPSGWASLTPRVPRAAPRVTSVLAAAQASDRPESGRVVDDVYSSDYFGFSLSLPKGRQATD